MKGSLHLKDDNNYNGSMTTLKCGPRIVMMFAISYLVTRLLFVSRSEMRFMNFLIATEDNVIANITFAVPVSLARSITGEEEEQQDEVPEESDSDDNDDDNNSDTSTTREFVEPLLLDNQQPRFMKDYIHELSSSTIETNENNNIETIMEQDSEVSDIMLQEMSEQSQQSLLLELSAVENETDLNAAESDTSVLEEEENENSIQEVEVQASSTATENDNKKKSTELRKSSTTDEAQQKQQNQLQSNYSTTTIITTPTGKQYQKRVVTVRKKPSRLKKKEEPQENGNRIDLTKERITLFRPKHDLRIGDVYSGMWWTSVNVLLNVPTHKMTWLEAATFMVVLGQVSKRVLMTMDIFDFSVEHLSTFFRFMRFDQNFAFKQKEYNQCLQSLKNYTMRVMSESPYHHPYRQNSLLPTESSITTTDRIPIEFRQTIAVIPFGLNTVFKEKNVDPGYQIRFESLVATLTSIWQLGIGRAVIVGGDSQEEADAVQNTIIPYFYDLIQNSSIYYESSSATTTQEDDEKDLDRTSTSRRRRRLTTSSSGTVSNSKSTSKDQRPHMEVAFIGGHKLTKNLPREAIEGIQYVFAKNESLVKPNSNDTMDTVTERWLGTTDLNKYKYVYFTEPDLILHTRPRMLPYLANGLRDDKILMAHRLQLIQHGSDFPNYTDPTLVIPNIGTFTNVTTIDSYSGDGCLLLGRNDRAGLKQPRCRKLWWRCGFGFPTKNYSDPQIVEQVFRLYKPYELIRIQHGTRFVTLAGTQQRLFCDIIKHNATRIPLLPDIIDSSSRTVTSSVTSNSNHAHAATSS